ncbi:MAG: flavodoxin [Eubacteriales bacterium]|nr:flavodoxin [Eubacteriales bacterium]
MKKITVLIIIGFVLAMLTACSSSVNDSHKKETGTNQSETTSSPFETVEITSEEKNTEIMDEEPEDIKIAVVYFSGTGNTKAIAEMIADEAGADIYEIVPAQTYTDEDLNYNDDNCRANKEQNDDTSRPEIANDLGKTTEYDIIYLGHPIWWGTVPRIMQTYLETYDLSDATIYTFCTSGGSSIDRSISDLKEWYPALNIVDGKRLNDATGEDIEEYCNR